MARKARLGKCAGMVGALLLSISLPSLAGTLTTTNYVVTITSHCEEGQVTCDNVTYHGRSKRSAEEIELTGETMHLLCGDKKTPCRFLGYHFQNKGYEYQVFDSGVLRVKHKGKLVVDERGQWKY